MKLCRAAVLALLAVFLLVGETEAGWKFWKSKKNDETTTTTEAPISSSSSPPKITPAPSRVNTNPNSNTNKALASAANPGLAIGIGNTGTNIRNNAQPYRPNPGTEVGLDVPVPRPNRPGVGGNNGQGYRDWAADLTGAGEGRQPAPRLPSQGPALTGGGQQPAPATGSRPGTPIGQPQGQRPGHPAAGQPVTGGQPQAGQHQPANRPSAPSTSRPAVQVSAAHGVPQPQGGSSDGRPQVSTLNIGSLNPGSRPGSPASPNTPQSRPGSPTSPNGGKTWAEIAATGTRPQSPIPAVRPGAIQGGQSSYPGQSGHNTPGQTRPAQIPLQPYGQPGHQGAQQPSRTGAAAGAAAAVAGGVASSQGFSSNPKYSNGNTITDDDLQKLSEALFIKDVNNANRYITLNLQKKTTGSSPVDEAPQPLLTVKSEALQIPTIQKVLALFNNYEHDVRVNEYVSPAERAEESLLVDTFLSTNVMSAAMRFLADKAVIPKDYYEYKDTLRRLWFTLYSRGEGKIGSSGFEHVFLSELRTGTEVLGLHNWIYYNAEEVSQRVNYLGYIKKLDLGDKAAIVKVHIKVNDVDKPVTTMFIGTSPELEMALYTVCFYARPGSSCPVSLGGTRFNIMTHKFRYRGKDLIGAAYPDI